MYSTSGGTAWLIQLCVVVSFCSATLGNSIMLSRASIPWAVACLAQVAGRFLRSWVLGKPAYMLAATSTPRWSEPCCTGGFGNTTSNKALNGKQVQEYSKKSLNFTITCNHMEKYVVVLAMSGAWGQVNNALGGACAGAARRGWDSQQG